MNTIYRGASYVLLALSAVLLITGQFPFAALTAALAVWGLKESGKASKADDLDPARPVPTEAELRRFRQANPDLSFHDALVEYQKR